jgi:RNA polymerase sigma-70 factor (ECF subfamily)
LNHPETIERLKLGDTTLFNDVVNRWQDKIYNTAISIVQNEEDAEDITQEVFVQLHESIGSIRGEALLSTWLYRVTVNKALDHEKKKKSKKRGGLLKSFFIREESDEPVHFEHPGVLAENKESAKALFHAMKKLPESQRIAFVLYKIEGNSFDEIAAITGNTRMAVESLMARAKTNLRKILKIWYEKNNH